MLKREPNAYKPLMSELNPKVLHGSEDEDVKQKLSLYDLLCHYRTGWVLICHDQKSRLWPVGDRGKTELKYLQVQDVSKSIERSGGLTPTPESITTITLFGFSEWFSIS